MIARISRIHNGEVERNGSAKSNHNGNHNGNGSRKKAILITGGSGFIGTNLAHRLISDGQQVMIYDNLSRRGVQENLRWLNETHSGRFHVEVADVRDRRSLAQAVRRASHVYHFAAQVAVTSSLEDPVHDFEVNARGTVNLLEAIRACPAPPSLVFTSTNKVYGSLQDVSLVERATRYEPASDELKAKGVSERRPLDFHSPYGCSKGTADQYILDFSRTFSIPAVVFRMSCIYGEHQFGNEDQGWVAHFLLRALQHKPLNIYGDGKQVRDILFAEDLVEAFCLARQKIHELAGQGFNIGGGPRNTISLLELIAETERLQGDRMKLVFGDWRPGDQRYYVSDTTKFRRATGWKPKVSVSDGIRKLYAWLQSLGQGIASHSRAKLRFNSAQPSAV